MKRIDAAGRDVTDSPGLWDESDHFVEANKMDDTDDLIDRKITQIFCGDEPMCRVCKKRHPDCRWRPAYQMMMCPECPK